MPVYSDPVLPGRPGGVINIITKKGGAGGKPASGHVSLGYGRYHIRQASAVVSGSAGASVDYHVSGGQQETDGYLRNNFQNTASFNSRVNLSLPRGGGLALGLRHSQVEYGMPVVNDPHDPDPAVAALYAPDFPVFTRGSDQFRHLNWPQLPAGAGPACTIRRENSRRTGFPMTEPREESRSTGIFAWLTATPSPWGWSTRSWVSHQGPGPLPG